MAKLTILAVSINLALVPNSGAEETFTPPPVNQSPSPQTAVRSTEEIILLPKMVVQGSSAPGFDEGEFYSRKGMDELLRKRFPWATFKGQPMEVDNYGLLMYDDEKRRDTLNHYQRLADLLKDSGDAAGSKELRDELNRTFIRSHDSKAERMDRSANGGRR